MTHTHGKWKAVVDTTPNKTISIVAETPNPDFPRKDNRANRSRHIATISVHGPREENEANAKLLAAAKDLLNALRDVLVWQRTFERGECLRSDLEESLQDAEAIVEQFE